jgi:hypothetical protein
MLEIYQPIGVPSKMHRFGVYELRRVSYHLDWIS